MGQGRAPRESIMNKTTLSTLAVLFSLLFIFALTGCGSNATSGGSSGGGGTSFVADIYVSTTGSDDAGDGSNAKPFLTISKAMTVIGSNETIGVKAGTYNEYVEWTTMEGVTLKGVSAETTIISREGADDIAIGIGYNLTMPPTGQTMTIEGITIRDCWPTYGETGGAISIWSPGVTVHLKDMIFFGNDNEDGSYDGFGGAVGVDGTSGALNVVMDGCSFLDNYADGDGGAVYGNSDVYFVIRNCLFKGNSETSDSDWGGGAIFTNRLITMESSCFAENESGEYGGAIVMNLGSGDGEGDFTNCLFLNNNSQYGGGALYLYNNSGDAVTYKLVNCTFASNEVTATGGSNYGGGIYNYDNSGSSDTIVNNCIFWGNFAPDDTTTADLFISTGSLEYNYSDGVNIRPIFTDGVGTTDAYPVFAAFPADSDHPDNLKLTASSPIMLREQGTTEGAPAKDISGTARSGHISMGAWQF
jgi:predicted outer membrane repeat protein